ncbi:transglycosylase domain-containing protein [Streptomyces sp. KR80]|uniref:transglycosylase domain-containing protein n=1 Tax=Streptomyces sp. KR80 TaxID=3457426 RepID=UPI003FD47A72
MGTFLVCFGAPAALFAVVYATVDIPSENAAARQEANVYYWADGSQMVSVGAVNRQNVPLTKVPVSLRNAAIAAENATFYSDSGVSFTGLARAALNMAGGQDTQGGSTITQQYVKNTYLSQEQTLSRKLREFCIALKVDSHKSKDEILQGYLNTSWFGRGAYGIQAAAQAYYGVDAEKLNPSQGAVLAALLKGAAEYDPALSSRNHQRAVKRWKWILDRQVALGMMSERERAEYPRFPEPRKQSKATNLGGQTGYLVDVAKRYVKKHTGLTDADLDRGGYRIHTTFDKEKVQQLERAVTDVLERDLDPATRPADRHVQVGAASVRPEDGAIVALYGGADATRHFTNNADTSGVPAGSLFKPFVLATALQHGAATRGGFVQPVSIDSYYDADGTLQTAGGLRLLRGSKEVAAEPAAFPAFPAVPGFPTLRDATVSATNTTFLQLGYEAGLERVEEMAVASGMLKDSMAPRDRSFPLGTSTPSAIRVADAYATFAADGVQHDPYSVTKVLKNGRSLPFQRSRPHRAMDPQVAFDVTSVLQEVPRNTQTVAVGLGRPLAAAATGKLDTMRAAWFVGYNEGLSTSVTMFRSRPGRPLLPMDGVGGDGSLRGSAFPARIFTDYMTGLSPAAPGGTRVAGGHG